MHLLSCTLVSANKLEIGGLQMHLHDINTLLNLQGGIVTDIPKPIDKTVYLTLEPEDRIQPCPSCGSTHTIRRGTSKPRYVRHLPIWGNIPLYIGVLSIFIATCIGVGIALGLMVLNSSKVTMFGQMIFLPSIMLSGIMFPATMLPEGLQVIGKVLPATWGYQNLMKVQGQELQLMPLLLALALMLAISMWKLQILKRAS